MRVFTPEWRAKLSAAAKRRRHTDEWKRNNGERMRGNTHRRGKPSSPETKLKQSLGMRGRVFTDSHRAALSKAAMGHPPLGKYWRGNHVHYQHSGKTHTLASSYELAVAKLLDATGEPWEYVGKSKEHSLLLDGGRRYYPDFFLPRLNLFIDPKGFDRDPLKRIAVHRRYPGRVIFLVGKTYLTQLQLLLWSN